jgi:hypothetical protein
MGSQRVADAADTRVAVVVLDDGNATVLLTFVDVRCCGLCVVAASCRARERA